DCEGGDTLLVLANPAGPTCSEGGRTCFDGDEKRIVGDVAMQRLRWGLGGQVVRIDDTLDERTAQIEDTAVQSYSLGLLRDPNKALKKFGEEVMEFVQAVIEEPEKDVEQELADLMFGALILARSREKDVSLESVLRILVARNEAKRAGSDERFAVPIKGETR
ncbi:phosphoribosyl-ATP diphosphatase, partial [Candidatus Saccharibacteria bacterium]|nr:phosphoribosyl-ATP diphosphatase [Candidatus Saccharibacteria bacterium]